MLSLHIANALTSLIPKRLRTSRLTAGPLLFLHIPKTAGTSFRRSLEAALGADSLLWDYGDKSPQTSTKVFDYLYAPNAGTEEHKHQLVGSMTNGQILAGHLHYRKYKSQFPPERTITFVRHPIERVISNYRHALRHQDFDCSLLEFAQQAWAINSLSRHLNGVPWTLYKFIGISERYDESLAAFNTLFSLRLRKLSLNKAPAKQKQSTQPTDQEIKEIEALNIEDIKLYQNICERFKLLQKEQDGGPRVITAGWRFQSQQNRIIGFVEASCELPEVTSSLNERLVAEEKEPVKKALSLPEDDRFRGFHIKLPDGTTPDTINLKLSIQEQPIFEV